MLHSRLPRAAPQHQPPYKFLTQPPLSNMVPSSKGIPGTHSLGHRGPIALSSVGSHWPHIPPQAAGCLGAPWDLEAQEQADHVNSTTSHHV